VAWPRSDRRAAGNTSAQPVESQRLNLAHWPVDKRYQIASMLLA